MAGKTVWTLPTSYAALLFGGALLAVGRRQGLFERIANRPRLVRWMGWGTLLVLVASCAVPTKVHPGAFWGVAYLWPAGPGVPLIIFAFAPNGIIRPLLEWKWLVWVGTFSYGLYVISFPILVFSSDIFPGIPQLLRQLTVCLVSIALAAASRRWYEGYFLLKKRSHSKSPSVLADAISLSLSEDPG